jgi:agmatine deiminase
MDNIPPIFADIVAALALGEEVHINITGQDMKQQIRTLLDERDVSLDRVFFHQNPTDDAWCRDHGPIFVQRSDDSNTEEAILDWGFNSWGEKYPPFDQDNKIPQRVADTFGITRFEPGIVLEGGSIDVNGAGTVLTTEACLLNANRNPHLSRQAIEKLLADFLGIQKVLWLGEGISGDDTDGHIDDLARFVDPTTVVAVVEDDPEDDNYTVLLDNLERLRGMTDQDGTPLRIVQLPMPPPVFHDGERLPASYANFYIANAAVLMPAYDPERDAIARGVLGALFPTREIVPINSLDLVWGLGSVHCVTQQWPALPR